MRQSAAPKTGETEGLMQRITWRRRDSSVETTAGTIWKPQQEPAGRPEL